MPFMLIVVGLVLVIVAIQNTYAALGIQLRKDFSGSNGFLVWILAIIATGAIGYIQGWEKFSRYMMALILIAIVFAQYRNTSGGLFGSFMAQIKNPKAPPASASTNSMLGSGATNWQSNGLTGDANPMNQGLFGQSSQGYLGDQSRFNNFMNSIVKGFGGGYN